MDFYKLVIFLHTYCNTFIQKTAWPKPRCFSLRYLTDVLFLQIRTIAAIAPARLSNIYNFIFYFKAGPNLIQYVLGSVRGYLVHPGCFIVLGSSYRQNAGSYADPGYPLPRHPSRLPPGSKFLPGRSCGTHGAAQAAGRQCRPPRPRSRRL